jgi:hypothetical protein
MGDDAELAAVRQVGAVGEHELDVPGETARGERSRDGGERVRGRGDHGHLDRPQEHRVHPLGRGGQGADHPESAAAVEHGLEDGAQGLDVEAQRRVGKGFAEPRDGGGERVDGEHHVHGDRQLGLESAREAPRTRLELVHAGDGRPRLGEEGAALLRQHGSPAAPVEEPDAELPLEIGEGLAHHRLGATELAADGGEAPFLHRGEEGAELIEGDAVQHIGHADGSH